VAVVPDGVEPRTTILTDIRAGAAWLARDFVDEIADACGRDARRLHAGLVADGARVLRIGTELEEELRLGGPGEVTAVESLAETLCVRLLRARPDAIESKAGEANAGEVRDRRVRAAVELIKETYAEPLDVETMARAAGMSRFHFSRAFRDATGKAPYAYLIDVRVRRAAEMLRSGRYTVTEAAFAVGFNDLSRFARAFRGRYGAAPAAWLRRVS
jgi:AraC-like DNA-binding protein